MTYRVLIVEDNEGKRRALRAVLDSVIECEVAEAPSVTQAFMQLRRQNTDLVLLDMSFQSTRGSSFDIAKEALAGIEVMQYIVGKRHRASVIVVTQHSNFATPEMPEVNTVQELDRLLRDGFPDIYRGVVQVVLAEETWKEELATLIRRCADVGS